ncbi:hypothetical protein [Niabella ginsengisoli]|uniref:DUF4421 domain-containing protein n=1 Tax=Niabella ginsengisoli TaxID=522298 RepID=A0ABS9SI33_9BACT|nr:hypothetical protein [Niabella ginsengisoli]MCH5597985.1 hypothetical protein [Niabella ginsengisoli]
MHAQTYTTAPDLGSLKKDVKEKLKNPFQLTGGFALNSVFTQLPANESNMQQPFSWIATGNLSINLLGYSMPFTFSYSNRKANYTNPNFKFNRLALHPKYKEWTAHIGDISTTFSPYTLNGFQYTGGGLEYNKGPWKAQGLYGRFSKAIKEDSIGQPSYKRMGWGAKVEYNDQGKKAGLTIFHAKDAVNSIPSIQIPANANVTPMEGTAVSLDLGYKLFKRLTLNGEYGLSVLTKNTHYQGDSLNTSAGVFGSLVKTNNPTSEVFHAFRTSLNYVFAQSVIGVNYERIDPGYRTLGGYFLQTTSKISR